MKRWISLFTALCLLFPGLSAAEPAQGQRYGAWLPYWEYDASLSELRALTGRLEETIAFACLFSNDDRLLMLDDTAALLSAMEQAGKSDGSKVYLSVVNDVEIAPGKYDNKSKALLSRLFADDASETAHLEDLTHLVDRYHLTGLELDYENLGNDTELWAQYVGFINRLWQVCARDGIALRIVLPWNAPKYAALPQGPEYSVMCYNLHGSFNGPGPKADVAFLNTTCELYRSLQPDVRMAFATGGFDWCGNKVAELTQQEAEAQLAQADVSPQRDADSGALNAAYTADGEAHEVWYADAATLALWRDTCVQNGYTASDLFCLGGNNLDNWAQAFFTAEP